jgi:hypothetical protein
MFTGSVENTSPTRQRVNKSQSVHSLALRACNGAKHGAVPLEQGSGFSLRSKPDGAFPAMRHRLRASRSFSFSQADCEVYFTKLALQIVFFASAIGQNRKTISNRLHSG